MIVQHMLDVQPLPLIGEWENPINFSIRFQSTSMSDRRVWAFHINVGVTNR